MFGFNLLTSKTVWAGLLAAVTVIGGAVQAGQPITWTVILAALTAILAAIGVRDAIAKNGVGSTPAKADQANGKTP